MRLPLLGLLFISLLTACAAPDGSTYRERIDAGKSSPDPRDKLRVGFGDMADAGTTAYGLWSGVATEANPLLAPAGDAVPIVLPIVKLGAKHAIVAMGATPRQANTNIETGGAAAACWNIGVLAGASTGVGAGLALACGLAYYDYMTKPYASPEERKARRANAQPAVVSTGGDR